VDSQQSAQRLAQQYGYPVIIKAAAGGGGRGIRVVQNEASMDEALRVAQAEAKAAFGDPSVYLEKYLDEPRHVEFQVIGDEDGNIVHLGERDCSIQYRWHQKILEESPSPALSPSLRRRMGEAAVKAAKVADYQNCGTVEFLVDKNDRFYFMEMNTRLQVEHPVTEAVTGLDLVAEQIRIAQGEKLGFHQREVHNKGWALECRIDARDPDNGLLPCAGTVTNLILPGGPGVRVDTHLYPNYEVSNHYDPLLAKVIVHAGDREAAVRKMERALSELVVAGVCTTKPLHQAILQNAFFRQGAVHTNFLRRRLGV
jgi:acetyl-CoA carboxylase biotin carboxylase subunit